MGIAKPATTLAKGELFRIYVEGDVVYCAVHNRQDIDQAHGAAEAGRMRETLLSKVIFRKSPYLGLVFDLRLAPTVFGPKTRDALGVMIGRAEAVGMRVGVLVGAAAIQKLQFESVCREYAPTVTRVSTALPEVTSWVGAPASGRLN